MAAYSIRNDFRKSHTENLLKGNNMKINTVINRVNLKKFYLKFCFVLIKLFIIIYNRFIKSL